MEHFSPTQEQLMVIKTFLFPGWTSSQHLVVKSTFTEDKYLNRNYYNPLVLQSTDQFG